MMSHAWVQQFFSDKVDENLPISFLAEQLQSGGLTPQEYYPWAQNHYQLAYLNSDYFQQNGISDAYRLTDHLLGNWGPTQIPIQIWDAVLFVACISPETVPNKLGPYTVTPLLAHVSDIAALWEIVHPKEVKKEVQFPDLPSKSISSVIHYQKPVAQIPIAQESREESPMDLLSDTPSESVEMSEEPPVFDMPEGLVGEIEAPVAAPNFISVAEPISGNKEFEDFASDAMLEALNIYEKVIFFIVDGNSVTGIRASQNIKMPEPNYSYSVDTANIFRIVASTQKPFHGKIHINEVNERFLIDWLEAKNPTVITIAPIAVDGEVKYMVGASSDQEIDKAEGLKKVLEISLKITDKYKELMAQASSQAA